jgi:glycerol transport system ATP-binding protein
MTVRDNLAFPLRNRGAQPAYIAERVQTIARMIGMEAELGHKARGLTADAKQKISLGRGMVREDVNALLFDEPLTVIDPHMKWELRTQLKALHHQFGHTMIYVTMAASCRWARHRNSSSGQSIHSWAISSVHRA